MPDSRPPGSSHNSNPRDLHPVQNTSDERVDVGMTDVDTFQAQGEMPSFDVDVNEMLDFVSCLESINMIERPCLRGALHTIQA